MRTKILAISFTALLLASCTHRVGGYTIMSSKNINVNSGKLQVTTERVKGIHSAQLARFDEATDRAIQNNKCAVALSDVATYVKQNFFTVSAIVEGNIVIDQNLPGCAK
ncbi:hypothetical protein EV693_10736 [Nicoletella semolina]|uniref:Lipoprotein n=1 Tax=Nicoletella semolina TaxID=271160 RepID=A0A4R2N8A1_9PAST|nr:hypothetical protein [Nicoletella semolina]MDH2923859.1 hypothetical protein [Nicoletella semolina]TCP17171.1 hypothetical protein EV693_10736 [Nicoletella semolina]